VIDPPTARDFTIPSLGEPTHPSPLQAASPHTFVRDEARLLADPHLAPATAAFAGGTAPPSFEVAGPRPRIYFEPGRVRAAIATCGGLSPGLNDVIRGLVMQLWYRYGVRSIFGARHGFQGLRAGSTLEPLTPGDVRQIHEQGGTVLGTSRGTPPVAEIVDTLVENGIDVFFTIGGDGTLRGATEICEAIARRGLRIAVVGLPKTIDNDVPWVRQSFGFQTAVRLAAEAVRAAHTEAISVRAGIGLVKLMGRNSGYLAANAAVATGHANFCIVPESPFTLEGEHGLLALLERRLVERSHALIVVAEGAGQYYFREADRPLDASGNRKLGDIGQYMRRRIEEHFRARRRHLTLKYIDPSYMVRTAPADTSDSLLCTRFAQNAVHAAMAGKTGLLIGYWHGQMTHVPFTALRGEQRTISPSGELWWNVLESTGQPLSIGDLALLPEPVAS
jgi:6-phosphofructokinase 1